MASRKLLLEQLRTVEVGEREKVHEQNACNYAQLWGYKGSEKSLTPPDSGLQLRRMVEIKVVSGETKALHTS